MIVLLLLGGGGALVPTPFYSLMDQIVYEEATYSPSRLFLHVTYTCEIINYNLQMNCCVIQYLYLSLKEKI
jgi:hypothetical protein